MFKFRCNECGILIGSPNRGYPNYFFGDDKQLYRFDSRGRVQRNKRVMIGYTQGYVLKSKFFSLSKLRPLLERQGDMEHPAAF